MEDEETSPSFSLETSAASVGRGANSEMREEKKEKSSTPDQDFSPQMKKLRTPQASPSPDPSPRSRIGGKRRSTAGKSALLSSMAPRKLSEPKNPPAEMWSCGACTYSNSSLLPYCEVCEFPRSSSGITSGKIDTLELKHDNTSSDFPFTCYLCVFLYFFFIHKLHFTDCKTNWIPLRKR